MSVAVCLPPVCWGACSISLTQLDHLDHLDTIVGSSWYVHMIAVIRIAIIRKIVLQR